VFSSTALLFSYSAPSFFFYYIEFSVQDKITIIVYYINLTFYFNNKKIFSRNKKELYSADTGEKIPDRTNLDLR